MDFSLTEEQELICNNMREFAKKHVDPIAAEIDANSSHPRDLFRKLGEGGWMGIPIPPEYGGAGADFMTHVIAVEEISRFCSSTGFSLSFHAGIIGMSILLFGNEAQKEKYLVPLAMGRHLGSFALTEPGDGTDVMAVATTALHQGTNYVINGTKTFVSNGPIADTYIIFGWTDKTMGKKGMSAFIVPRGTPGLKPGEHFQKMGLRSSQTSEVVFRDCLVAEENLLGQEGDGLPIAMTGFDRGRIGIAAQALGILQAALDESIKYSRERIQFGKPIARQQAIAWMIADMANDLAAWRKDNNQAFSKEAAMAKLFATEAAARHTIKAVQIHRGYGYIKGAKVERLMRDAKIAEIYEGTSEAQRMVISGNVLRGGT